MNNNTNRDGATGGLQLPTFSKIRIFTNTDWFYSIILQNFNLRDTFLAILENLISKFSCAFGLTLVGPHTSLDLIFSPPPASVSCHHLWRNIPTKCRIANRCNRIFSLFHGIGLFIQKRSRKFSRPLHLIIPPVYYLLNLDRIASHYKQNNPCNPIMLHALIRQLKIGFLRKRVQNLIVM